MQPLSVGRRMHFMPPTVEPSDSVAHARALLEEFGIKHLPVVSEGQLVGIISSRDLRVSRYPRRRAAFEKALELHPERITVREVMITRVDTATPSDTLTSAAKLMLRRHVGALPVLERGHLIGIIRRSDIGDTVAALDRQTAKGNLRPTYRADRSKRLRPARTSVFAATRSRTDLHEEN
jgi:acetoin utilization protein AcuB